MRAAVKKTVSRGRAAVPDVMVPPLVRTRARRHRRHPQRWDVARQHMRFLLEDVDPGRGVDAVAERWLEQMAWRAELRWHPGMTESQPVEGVEHLVKARRRGSVIVNYLHHGQYDGAKMSVARASGLDLHFLIASTSLRPDAPTFLKQHVSTVARAGTIVSTAVGSAGIVELLTGPGAVLFMATDHPGQTEMTVFGKRLIGGFGAARLAHLTDTQVVVLTSHPGDGPGRACIRLAPALDPSDFDSAHELQAQMLAQHQRAVLAWPEGYDVPLNRWGRVLDDGTRVMPKLASLTGT